MQAWDHGGNLAAEEYDVDRAMGEYKCLLQKAARGEKISPIMKKHARERIVLEVEDLQDKELEDVTGRANAYLMAMQNFTIH